LIPASLPINEMKNQVLFNQLVVTPLMIWVLGFGNETMENTVVDLFMGIVKYPFMLLILNFTFGTMHFLFHKNRFLYRHFHSLHHRLKIPHPMGAIYAHPVEHVFANLMPVGLAIWCVNAGWLLTLVFVAHISYETVSGHSVYSKEELNTRHYIHHDKMIYNFDNSPYLFDRLIGTYN